MVTFALVPVRSRVLAAKILASLALVVVMLAMLAALVAAGVLVASPPVDGVWTDAVALIAQTFVFLAGGILTGVAFGAAILASAPAIVALFAFPIAWTAVATLSLFADVAPWLDTRLALAPLHEEVVSATQWAHAGTALAVWMLLPLLIGTWRITRCEVSV
jgi:ABC-type transport system involved in multi-copper enzyme maturation permease subunit